MCLRESRTIIFHNTGCRRQAYDVTNGKGQHSAKYKIIRSRSLTQFPEENLSKIEVINCFLCIEKNNEHAFT